MTLIVWRRHIAHREAQQLRRYPPRLWPLITQETTAWRILCDTRQRLVPTQPMELDMRTRIGTEAA